MRGTSRRLTAKQKRNGGRYAKLRGSSSVDDRMYEFGTGDHDHEISDRGRFSDSQRIGRGYEREGQSERGGRKFLFYAGSFGRNKDQMEEQAFLGRCPKRQKNLDEDER